MLDALPLADQPRAGEDEIFVDIERGKTLVVRCSTNPLPPKLEQKSNHSLRYKAAKQVRKNLTTDSFRTKGGLNEHLGRHENVTGPDSTSNWRKIRVSGQDVERRKLE